MSSVTLQLTGFFMAYKKVKAGSYKWPVTITLAKEDGSGDFDKFAMTLEFRRLKRTEIEGLKNNVELLKKAVCGWSGYQDSAGAEIKFTDKEFEEMMEDTAFVPAAASAFWESVSGAQEKN